MHVSMWEFMMDFLKYSINAYGLTTGKLITMNVGMLVRRTGHLIIF